VAHLNNKKEINLSKEKEKDPQLSTPITLKEESVLNVKKNTNMTNGNKNDKKLKFAS
jgi:hypothetical protein